MDKPVVAGKEPIPVDLKKDETYYYCTCGKSDNNRFVMEITKVLHLSHKRLPLKKMKRRTSVLVSTLAILHIVMVHTKIFNRMNY